MSWWERRGNRAFFLLLSEVLVDGLQSLDLRGTAVLLPCSLARQQVLNLHSSGSRREAKYEMQLQEPGIGR